MTSILPIRNIKARTRALVPLQKPVFNHQNKTRRAGNRTGAFGEVVFFGGRGFFFKARLVPFPAAFGGGDEAGLADLGCTIVRPRMRGLRGSEKLALDYFF